MSQTGGTSWKRILLFVGIIAMYSTSTLAQTAKNGPCGEMQGFGLVNHKGWDLPFLQFKVKSERHPYNKTSDLTFNKRNVYVSELEPSKQPMAYPFPVIIGKDCTRLFDSYIKLERILRYDIDGMIFAYRVAGLCLLGPEFGYRRTDNCAIDNIYVDWNGTGKFDVLFVGVGCCSPPKVPAWVKKKK